MKPAPKWLYMTSIAVTTITGIIFYGVGLHESNITLTDAGIFLVLVGAVSAVAYTNRPTP